MLHHFYEASYFIFVHQTLLLTIFALQKTVRFIQTETAAFWYKYFNLRLILSRFPLNSPVPRTTHFEFSALSSPMAAAASNSLFSLAPNSLSQPRRVPQSPPLFSISLPRSHPLSLKSTRRSNSITFCSADAPNSAKEETPIELSAFHLALWISISSIKPTLACDLTFFSSF